MAKRTVIAITYTVLLAALAALGWNLKTIKDDLVEISKERAAVEETKDTSFVFDTTLSVPAEINGLGEALTKIRSFHTNGVSAIVENEDHYLYVASDGYVVAVKWKTKHEDGHPALWRCAKPSLEYLSLVGHDDPARFEKNAIYNLSEAFVLHPRSCECLFNHCSK